MAAAARRPGRPKGAQEDPLLRLDRLLAATEAAIRIHGPDVSMEQVAQVAEVSRSTLYDNFESRGALVVAVVDRFGQPMLQDLLTALGEERTPEAIVRTGLRIYIDHVEANPEVYRFVVRNIGGDDLFQGVSAVLGALVAAGMPADESASEVAEELGSAVFGAIVSATERWSERGTPPRADFERVLADFVWGGLVAGGLPPVTPPIDLTTAFAHLR